MNTSGVDVNIGKPIAGYIFASNKRNRVMKKTLFIFTFLGAFSTASMAQKVMSLDECLHIGIEQNLALKTQQNEIQKGKYGVSENRAKLLPQINGFANFNDNFKAPVSVTDGSSYGVPYNVTHTLPYSANTGIQLQMPLYNQTAYTALDIARTVENMNRQAYEKAREDLIVEITKIYYLGQTTDEQLKLIQENIARLEELKGITEAFYDNGMAMEVDVKRVNINLENMKVQYDNVCAMKVQQMNMLKYVLDYPADSEFELEPVQPETLEPIALTGLSENLSELALLQSKTNLAEKQRKLVRNGYIPSLSLTGSYSVASYTDQVRHWFHSHPSNKWYHSCGVGLSLRVPLFDGLEKRSKTMKAELDIQNARLALENAHKSLQTQYLNATNDLMNNQRNFQKQKDNYLLAEDVYEVTSERYREGIASMTEVLQDEMSMSEAQNNYISAHYNYRVTNLALMKLTGQLEMLFNK